MGSNIAFRMYDVIASPMGRGLVDIEVYSSMFWVVVMLLRIRYASTTRFNRD